MSNSKTNRLDAAIAAHRAGRVIEARELYEAIIVEDPKALSAISNLALIHTANGSQVVFVADAYNAVEAANEILAQAGIRL